MNENVVALPGHSIPSLEPVERVIEILEEFLASAKSGRLIGVAVVAVERDPPAFLTEYHGQHPGRHTLAAGVLSLGYQIGQEISE